MGVAQAPGRLGTDPGLEAGPSASRSERVYAALLRAYPAPFRARYRDEMALLFGDQLRDARAARGSGGVATTWLRTLLDLVSSAAGEHLRKDRSMAQSVATFEPTRTMRILGLFGLLGAILLLWAFLSFNPFDVIALNRVRLVMFALAYVAISLAFYRRQALVAPTLALITTAFVVSSAVCFAAWVVFAIGGSPTRRRVTKLAFTLLICSVVGWFGDDRLGMVDSLFGEIWQAVALGGVLLAGTSWLLLSAVLLVGNRTPTMGQP
jgi:hypothetical protein